MKNTSGAERMAQDFWEFVNLRIDVVHASVPKPVIKAREDAEKKVSAARDALRARLGGGKEAWLLVDALESATTGRGSVEDECLYAQGLADGSQLAEILRTGRAVSWLGAAYPVPTQEEAAVD